MKRFVYIPAILVSCFLTAFSQSVEITGQLKVSDVPANNTATDIVVRNANGTLEKRDASTLGSIPSSAIVLSETDNNTALINAGFQNTGAMSFNFSAKSTTVNYGEWTAMNPANLPSARFNQSAVWTGTHVIFWGGLDGNSNYINTGFLYNPALDSWTVVSTTNAPVARSQHTALWTGTEMIIWGGRTGSSSFTNTGAKYNPVTNTWTSISTVNAPAARTWHASVWTGSEMIIWGGGTPSGTYNTGGKYNPVTDTWTPTTTISAPIARSDPTAVWTGTEMIIWGGYSTTVTNTGGKYNPVADTWTSTTTSSAPLARTAHVAVWSGTEMIIWGGYDGSSSYFNTGGKYNPSTDTWVSLSLTNVPEGRYYPMVAWTGTEMIVWGGGRNSGTLYYDSGGKYNPNSNMWIATPMINVPAARRDFSSAWTGTEWVIWGGLSFYVAINSGAKFNPNLQGYAPASPVVRYLYKKN